MEKNLYSITLELPVGDAQGLDLDSMLDSAKKALSQVVDYEYKGSKGISVVYDAKVKWFFNVELSLKEEIVYSTKRIRVNCFLDDFDSFSSQILKVAKGYGKFRYTLDHCSKIVISEEGNQSFVMRGLSNRDILIEKERMKNV